MEEKRSFADGQGSKGRIWVLEQVVKMWTNGKGSCLDASLTKKCFGGCAEVGIHRFVIGSTCIVLSSPAALDKPSA